MEAYYTVLEQGHETIFNGIKDNPENNIGCLESLHLKEQNGEQPKRLSTVLEQNTTNLYCEKNIIHETKSVVFI